jgi:DNA-binding GntR family transcriptional regulator
VQRSFEEHQTIVDALRAADEQLAALSVRSHVVVQGERFGDLIAGLSQMARRSASETEATPAAPLALRHAG